MDDLDSADRAKRREEQRNKAEDSQVFEDFLQEHTL